MKYIQPLESRGAEKVLSSIFIYIIVSGIIPLAYLSKIKWVICHY